VRVHLGDRLEEQVARLPMPVLALRGEGDRLSTERWMDDLVGVAKDGEWSTMPGAHTFVWMYPDAWSAPLRRLAQRVA
ncbi:MAG: alpha/beta hydrolase, partial [Actinomycetota bacterium]|nr:alpha/beta hydrolase [Actinomycetota bacterium]